MTFNTGCQPMGPSLAGVRCYAAVGLLPLPPETTKQLRARGPEVTKGRLQIGLYRPMPQAIVVNSATTAQSWGITADGWHVLTITVTSAQALGLRLHLASLSLPPGTRFLVYDPSHPGQLATPLTAEDIAGKEAWTETVFSERVLLECEVPPGQNPAAVSFKVTGVSHLYGLPTPNLTKEGSCHNDVTCYPDWSEQAAGTARIEFVDSGSTYLCTGCLLNVNDPNAAADYFLTANHCIDNQTIASTLELYWFFQTSSCNGTPPALSSVPHTSGGADFLAGSGASDFAFMRLRHAAPSGVFYLGWTTTLPEQGEPVTCVHHPDAAYKRISFGNEAGTDGSFWNVQWYSGVTEPGSSGAPLFNSQHQVIGQLYGGLSSCSDPSGVDTFGRFDQTYPAIQPWIDPGAATVSPLATLGTNNFGSMLPTRGNYSGLFASADGVAQESAGFLTLRVSSKGGFSGRLIRGTARTSLSGKFGVDGAAQVSIPRLGMMVQLQTDSEDPDRITGTLSDGNWTADLTLDRAVFDGKDQIAPQAGRYTMVIPAVGASGSAPSGDSYGSIVVSKSGMLRFTGGLGDGTKVSQSVALSKHGQWPFYAQLYGGQGTVLSWLTFTNVGGSLLDGSVNWFSANKQKARYYEAGFNLTSQVIGSAYVPTGRGQKILNLAQGVVALSGGDLTLGLTNLVSLAAGNRVANLSGNRLTLSFVGTTGIFRGSVFDPVVAKSIRFSGAVLQNQNSGYGFFLGQNQTGQVALAPVETQ